MATFGGATYGGVPYAGAPVTGGNPYHNFWANTITEIAFTSNPLDDPAVWVDVSLYVQSIQTNRGRQHELNRFEAGTVTVTLKNLDGRFSPFNTSGAYYPNVLPYKQIRIRSSWNGVLWPIFRGHITAWPVKWPSPADSTVTVQAFDALKILNLKKAASVNTTYASTITANTPFLYWRLDDAPNSATAADSSGNGRAGAVVTQTPSQGARVFTFGAAGAVIGDTDTALDCGAVGGMVQLLGTSFTVQNSTIEFWIKWAAGQGGNDACQIVNAGASGITIIGGINGVITWVASDGTNSTGLQNSGSGLNDGNWHHFALVVNSGGTSAQSYVDGITTTSASAAPGAIVNTAINVYAGGGGIVTWNGLLDEFVLYQSALSAATITAHYNAGARPRENETTGARIQALLTATSWPASLSNIDMGQIACQPATNDVINNSVLANCQVTSDTELGELFADAAGKVTFFDQTRKYRVPTNTPAVILGDSGTTGPGGESPYLLDSVDIAFDDLDIYNEATITPAGKGAQTVTDITSQTTYGKRTLAKTGVQSNPSDAKTQAQILVDKFKTPLQRIRQISFTPMSDVDVLFPAALGFELLTRVTVKRRPKDGAGSTFTQDSLIEGIEHVITPGSWTTTWRLSPTDASPLFFILNDPVAGLLDGTGVLV